MCQLHGVLTNPIDVGMCTPGPYKALPTSVTNTSNNMGNLLMHHRQRGQPTKGCRMFWERKFTRFLLVILTVFIGAYMIGRIDEDVFQVYPVTIQQSSIKYDSPIYDQTLEWDPHLRRVWLDYESRVSDSSSLERPPYMIVLTSYEWNQRNQRKAMRYSRSIRSTQLYQAIVNHPFFHPHAYQQIRNGTRAVDPTLTYYVVLDVETCFEANYPNYGKSYYGNCDGSFRRAKYSTHIMKRIAPCYNFESCHYIDQELQTNPIFTSDASKNQLVLLDCRGNGQSVAFRKVQHPTSQIALVTLSSTASQLQTTVDQGLPPPAVQSIQLSTTEQAAVSECQANTRPYFLTFSGDFKRHAIRKELAQLDTTRNAHPSNHSIFITDSQYLRESYHLTYTDLLKQSEFAAVPRGDNLYSYRFTEVLAAGAIPVLLGNPEWVLPFRPEWVDWSQCVIRIENVSQVVPVLQSLETCQRRQYCYSIYQKYMAGPRQVIDGIWKGLEAVRQGRGMNTEDRPLQIRIFGAELR